jgi:hypothetical protein
MQSQFVAGHRPPLVSLLFQLLLPCSFSYQVLRPDGIGMPRLSLTEVICRVAQTIVVYY